MVPKPNQPFNYYCDNVLLFIIFKLEKNSEISNSYVLFVRRREPFSIHWAHAQIRSSTISMTQLFCFIFWVDGRSSSSGNEVINVYTNILLWPKVDSNFRREFEVKTERRGIGRLKERRNWMEHDASTYAYSFGAWSPSTCGPTSQIRPKAIKFDKINDSNRIELRNACRE